MEERGAGGSGADNFEVGGSSGESEACELDADAERGGGLRSSGTFCVLLGGVKSIEAVLLGGAKSSPGFDATTSLTGLVILPGSGIALTEGFFRTGGSE